MISGILVIMTTMVIVFKHCVDSLSSREKKSTSMNNNNDNFKYQTKTGNYTSFLSHNVFTNSEESEGNQFRPLYDFTEKKSEGDSIFKSINILGNHTNSFSTDFWNKELEKPKSTIYDLRIDVERILNNIETRNLNQRQVNSFRREETNKSKKKKTKYPRYFE